MSSKAKASVIGDRRGRTPGSGSKRGQAMQASWADVTDDATLLSPRGDAPEWKFTSEAMPHGPSILKEIFPDHGKVTAQLTGPILDRLPSPSRAAARRRNAQAANVPGNYCPAGGLHMPMPPASPARSSPNAHQWQATMPPASPAHSSPNAHQWQGTKATLMSTTPPREPALASYRERLRAGGRGALQRSQDAGIVPKSMHQEWGAMQTASAYDGAMQTASAYDGAMQTASAYDGYMTQQSMDYGMAGDSQLMWNCQEQMSCDDYWGASMNSQQYPLMQQGQMQEVWGPQPTDLLLPLESVQMGPMTPHGQCPQTPQMGPMTPHSQCPQTPQMGPMTPHGQCPQTPQMQFQVNTPTDIGRCMAIVMPSEFPCDSDLMALQLKAAAESCQCYED